MRLIIDLLNKDYEQTKQELQELYDKRHLQKNTNALSLIENHIRLSKVKLSYISELKDKLIKRNMNK